ncbi:MAG: putative transposase [Acidobacteriota bacterium]|nr:putative transposase [Acidobacteriota bacterium]
MKDFRPAHSKIEKTHDIDKTQERSRLTHKVLGLAKRILLPNLKFKTHHNCKFTRYDYFKLLTYAGTHHCYAEGSSYNLKFGSETLCPTAGALFHHLKKFSKDELSRSYQQATDDVILMAKNRGLLNGPVTVAIDLTDERYYGNKNDPMVVGTEYKLGTTNAYRFATLTVTEKHCRLVIRAIPVAEGFKKHEVVADLIAYAKERIEIGLVCMDRGFHSTEVYSTFDAMGVKYLTPAIMTSRTLWAIRAQQPPKIIPFVVKNRDRDKNVQTNLVVVLDDDMERMCYFTNMEVDRMHTRQLNKLYAKRWGIETAFREMKKFKAKTTSKNYVIRWFYFLFSMCLYNLWEYSNMLLSALNSRPGIPDMTTLMFGTLLFNGFEQCGAPTQFIIKVLKILAQGGHFTN